VLAFNNERLEENRTLESYGIHGGHIVYLALKLKEAYAASDGSLLRQESSGAPRWRLVNEGLNIEGKCSNRLCAAFSQMVIHPFLFESFNLVRERCIVLCPMCHAQLTPLTCGFYNCVWRCEGIRTRDGCSISSSWKDADDAKYHKFTDGTDSLDTRQWKSLLVVVKSRCAADAAKLVLPSRSPGIFRHEVCTICWASLWFTPVTAAPCAHTFHRCCLEKWSTWCSSHDSLPSCPVCRRSLQV
jgi:hypothetical protein